MIQFQVKHKKIKNQIKSNLKAFLPLWNQARNEELHETKYGADFQYQIEIFAYKLGTNYIKCILRGL